MPRRPPWAPRPFEPAVVDPAEVLRLLDVHHAAFYTALPAANATGHPVPCDTKAWSQILVSLLTGIPGLSEDRTRRVLGQNAMRWFNLKPDALPERSVFLDPAPAALGA